MRADKNPSFLIVEVVEVVFFIVGLLVELNLIVLEIVYSTAGECKGERRQEKNRTLYKGGHNRDGGKMD